MEVVYVNFCSRTGQKLSISADRHTLTPFKMKIMIAERSGSLIPGFTMKHPSSSSNHTFCIGYYIPAPWKSSSYWACTSMILAPNSEKLANEMGSMGYPSDSTYNASSSSPGSRA